MFSTQGVTAPPGFTSRGTASAAAEDPGAAALRVLPTTGDPTDEVRASLASLTARAQRLVSDVDSDGLMRNGYGLYAASRKAAEEARQQANRCLAATEGFAPATHASVELFMSQHLGFDAQAQQRLLQQLQHRQSQLGADLGPLDALAGAEGTGFMGGTDVESVVAEIQNGILLDVQHAVHRRQTNLVREQVDTLFKAAWHPFYVRIADDYETLSMSAAELAMQKAGAGNARLTGGATARLTGAGAGGTSIGGSSSSSANLLDLLHGDSAFATDLNHRIAAFAAIVDGYAPLQWVTNFTAYVTEAAMDVADEMTVLWASVAQMLETLQRRGSEVDALDYVAASRRVMERKSLSRMLERMLHMDPLRFEEVENMSPSHLLGIITRYCGTGNHWMHAFVAMRVGRYDVAILAAQALGIKALTTAMEKMSAASPMERNTMAPAAELQPIYAEAATREDPYRQAVLLLLLAGNTGENPAAVLRTMLGLSQRITDSIEDAVWLRLTCVRGVEESAQVAPVQSLRTLQRAVLDDMQDLVSLTQGSACRLASFLLHVMLPSTGLRLLLENTYTHVDGLHMTLCFSAQNLLSSGVHASLEAAVDVARHVTRYASVVLLEVDRRSRAAAFAGSALFSYFYKSGHTEAFVECCLKDTICARLLGSRTAVGGQDALLLRGGAGALTEELLLSLIEVAEAASIRNEVAKAVHVLLAVSQLAAQMERYKLQQKALLRAVQIIAPALAQALHLPPNSTLVSDVLSEAAQLQQVLRTEEQQPQQHLETEPLAAQDYQSFALLCDMADVYAYCINGSVSDAVSGYLQLPFVPAPNSSASGDVDVYVEGYCNAPPSVQLGAAALLPLVMAAAGQLLQLYARSRAEDGAAAEQQVRLLQRMQAVCAWARQCHARISVAYPAAAEEFESTYLR